MKHTREKITALRGEMEKIQLDVYLMSSGDPHQSEYVADRWKTRTWISGFSGSAGTLVVDKKNAGLWTDSRYFLQAETELKESGIVLQRQKVPHAPEHIDWLAANLPANGRLGFDGQVVSLAMARFLESKCAKKQITLVPENDLVDNIWKDRPAKPASEIFELDVSFAGESRAKKLTRLRAWMEEKQADALFLVALDEIAWLLNIRASDVEYNPVCISYLLVTKENATWYVGENRVSKKLSENFSADGVHCKAYEAALNDLVALPKTTRLAIDPATFSYAFYQKLTATTFVETPSPIQGMKTIKNSKEIKHFKSVMVKDGVALVKLFHWLETSLKTQGITEVEVAEKLKDFRSQGKYYHGESFGAIVGYKGNGAIVHYSAKPDSCATIQAEGILLLDSGGQYHDGTTDITRTVTLGDPTMAQRKHFTLVLKGMIALTEAQFPEGTTGAQLDTFARQFLWQEGLDFGHGTGHGVGFFLNVHEGPQGFATSAVTSRGRTAFQEGMVTSNEPGFYLENEYGIRIENLILCVPKESTDFGNYLGFETLTLFPIDKKLILMGMLTETEKKWLNNYHALVHQELAPYLKGEELKWLHIACRML